LNKKLNITLFAIPSVHSPTFSTTSTIFNIKNKNFFRNFSTNPVLFAKSRSVFKTYDLKEVPGFLATVNIRQLVEGF